MASINSFILVLELLRLASGPDRFILVPELRKMIDVPINLSIFVLELLKRVCGPYQFIHTCFGITDADKWIRLIHPYLF